MVKKFPCKLSSQVKVLGRCLVMNYRMLLRTVAREYGSVSQVQAVLAEE